MLIYVFLAVDVVVDDDDGNYVVASNILFYFSKYC